MELLRHDKSLDKNSETIIALEQILELFSKPPIEFSFDSENGLLTNANRLVKIIMPGSKGLNIKHRFSQGFHRVFKRHFYYGVQIILRGL